MATVTIRGISVTFPFEPYDIQKNYMEKVIESLQNETNAVLESPTGTGKTLSLLCSSLAWLEEKKRRNSATLDQLNVYQQVDNRFNKSAPIKSKSMWDIPKIIYASRTHSQLIQVMQELKRTTYSKKVKASIIGSREQMCTHPSVSQEANQTNKVHMCRTLVKSRSCYLYNRVERMSCSAELHESSVLDIEDLVRLGEKNKFCPYYMSRELQKGADIMFLPYNYLLDPKTRRNLQMDLKNSVVILDEAHNVERICEDSASFQIKTTDIALCIVEVTTVMKKMEENASLVSGEDMDFCPEDLILLKTMLMNLEKAVDDIPIQNSNEGSTFGGSYIFEVFGKAGINDETQGPILSLLDKLIQFLATSQENTFQRSGNGLQLLQDLLLVVYQNTSMEFKNRIGQCYKVHMSVEEPKKKREGSTSSAGGGEKSGCRVLSYWCFSPGFGMGMLLEQGVRSVILTSGTLAPLGPLVSELGMRADVRLENPHVVGRGQVYVKVVGSGPDGTPLNSSYNNRDNASYIASLGMAIMNIVRQVPGGVLVFFPSYPVMARCEQEWRAGELWSALHQLKPVVVEPRDRDAFSSAMRDYYGHVSRGTGAVFMAVCRGKVSEGLDFADANGRAVIVTGLPFPPLRDPRVILKRQYLDTLHNANSEYLDGRSWYSLEATRAVNQAIGRVIRHRRDYGAILLLDNRFTGQGIRSQMSLWLRDMILPAKNFGETVRELKAFFKDAELNFPCAIKSKTMEVKKQEGLTNSTSSRPSTSGIVGRTNAFSALGPSIGPDGRPRKRKFQLVQVDYSAGPQQDGPPMDKEATMRYIQQIRQTFEKSEYRIFQKLIAAYKDSKDYETFIAGIEGLFRSKSHGKDMLYGLVPYIFVQHREQFAQFCDAAKLH